jgi:hypothetical protein
MLQKWYQRDNLIYDTAWCNTTGSVHSGPLQRADPPVEPPKMLVLTEIFRPQGEDEML